MGNKAFIVSAVGLVGVGIVLYNGKRWASPTIHDKRDRGTGTSFADKYDGFSRTDIIEELYKSKAQTGLLSGMAMAAAAVQIATFADL